jgi:hypothetical protein
MHPKTVYTKTSKGVLEVKNKTIKLPRDLGLVFLSVDGKSTIADLVQKAGMPQNKLQQALDQLVADGYIKVFSSPGAASTAAPAARAGAGQDQGDELDFTSPEAMTKLNAEAEVRAKAEAAAKARAQAAARATAEAKMRQEAEARGRAQAEAKARAEAEAKVKAEEAARAATEAQVQAEAEAKAAADAKARAEAESRIKAAMEA